MRLYSLSDRQINYNNRNELIYFIEDALFLGLRFYVTCRCLNGSFKSYGIWFSGYLFRRQLIRLGPISFIICLGYGTVVYLKLIIMVPVPVGLLQESALL